MVRQQCDCRVRIIGHIKLIWSQPYNVRAETEAGAGGEPNRHGTTPSRNRILAYRLRRCLELLARSFDKS